MWTKNNWTPWTGTLQIVPKFDSPKKEVRSEQWPQPPAKVRFDVRHLVTLGHITAFRGFHKVQQIFETIAAVQHISGRISSE